MKRFIVLFALVMLSGCGSAATVAPTAVIVSVPTLIPTAAPSPTTAPTKTPVPPTNTPKPTSTPKPTATPVPTETPVPFADVIVHGKGQRVVDGVTLPAGWYIMTYLHQGKTGNTVVESIAPDGTRDLLVNVIGCCGGSYLLDSSGGDWQFAVKAVGEWTIAIGKAPVDENDVDKVLIGGAGDSISKVFNSLPEHVAYIFTHEGDANFTVWLTCDDGSRQLLQNEIGVVANEAFVDFPSAKCLWEVRGNGDWVVTDSKFFKTEMCKPETDMRPFLRDLCDSMK